QLRRRARAHVGVDDAADLATRIGGVPYALPKGGKARALEGSSKSTRPLGCKPCLRLSGLFQAAALNVVAPAVVDAAEPAILDPAVAQVGPPVAAMDAQQARLALIVPEQHQVLAQQAGGDRRPAGRDLLAQPGRLPVAAKQIAGRRAGAGSG